MQQQKQFQHSQKKPYVNKKQVLQKTTTSFNTPTKESKTLAIYYNFISVTRQEKT